MCRSLNFTGGCGLLLSRNAEQTCTSPDATYDMPDVFGWGSGASSARCFPVVYRFKAAAANSIYTFPGTGEGGKGGCGRGGGGAGREGKGGRRGGDGYLDDEGVKGSQGRPRAAY